MHADKKVLGITEFIFVVDFFVEKLVLSKKILSGYLFSLVAGPIVYPLQCLVRRRSTVSCDPNTTGKETVEEITIQVIFEFNLREVFQ